MHPPSSQGGMDHREGAYASFNFLPYGEGLRREPNPEKGGGSSLKEEEK